MDNIQIKKLRLGLVIVSALTGFGLAFLIITYYMIPYGGINSQKSMYISDSVKIETLRRKKLLFERENQIVVSTASTEERETKELVDEVEELKKRLEKLRRYKNNQKVNLENELPYAIRNAVDKMKKNLEKAIIVYDTPSRMRKNVTQPVKLHMSPTKSIQELLTEFSGKEKQSARIKYSNRTSVKLISGNKDAFEITSLAPNIQAIATLVSDENEWRWDVTALKTGEQFMHLTVTALIEVEGSETPIWTKTFDRKIKVFVTNSQLIKEFYVEHWEYILGVFGSILGFWGFKSKKDTPTTRVT